VALVNVNVFNNTSLWTSIPWTDKMKVKPKKLVKGMLVTSDEEIELKQESI